MQRAGGMGSGGSCVCLGCGATKPHEAGRPCQEERCPKCGKAMVREGSEHHLAYMKKKEGRHA
jgi:hypothetical protein